MARFFANRRLNTFSPPVSPLTAVFIAGVEGELVLGVIGSLPICCADASPNILFALLVFPRTEGVSCSSFRF